MPTKNSFCLSCCLTLILALLQTQGWALKPPIQIIRDQAPTLAKYFGEPLVTIGETIFIGDKTTGKVLLFDANANNPNFGKLLGEINPPESELRGFGSFLIPLGTDLVIPAMKTIETVGDEEAVIKTDVWIYYRFDGDRSSPTFRQFRHIMPLPEVLSPYTPIVSVNDHLMAFSTFSSARRDDTTYNKGVVYVIDADLASETYGLAILTLEHEIESYDLIPLGEKCAFANDLLLTSKWITGTEYSNHRYLTYCWYDCNQDSPTFGQLLHETSFPGEYRNTKIILPYDAITQNIPMIEGYTTVNFYDANPENGTLGEVIRTITLPQPASGWAEPSGIVTANQLFISDSGYDGAQTDSGAIYVFDNDPASATYGQLVHTLENPTPATADFSFNADQFGATIAFAGGNIVTSAIFDDTAGLDAGAVYVFDGGDYTQKTMITTGNHETSRFGHAVSAAGDYLAVSLPLKGSQNVNEGTVQLYNPVSGALVTTLENPDHLSNGLFGEVMASDGRVLAIKSTFDTTGSLHTGRVHLFDVDPASATFGDHLITIDRPALEYDQYETQAVDFGAAMAFGNGQLLITCPTFAQMPASKSRYLPIGVTFIFDADPDSAQFGQQLDLVINPFLFDYVDNPPAGTRLSNALAFMGDYVLMGSIWDGTEPSGRVFVVDPDITQDKWDNEIKLQLNDPQPEMKRHFGAQATVVGDLIAVTSAKTADAASSPSVVYLFDGKIGTPTASDLLLTIVNPEPDRSENFGNQLEARDGMLIIGALNKFSPEGPSGTVYIYDVDPASPTFGEVLFGLDHSVDEVGFFGNALAIIGTRIFVGNPIAGLLGDETTEAVQVYDLSNAVGNWDMFR